jgi:hypothetical protein
VSAQPQDGLFRLTAEQVAAQAQADASRLFTVRVEGKLGSDNYNQVEVSPPAATAPPALTLPVAGSAMIGLIRSEGAATGAALAGRHSVARLPLERRLAAELATLARRKRASEDADRVARGCARAQRLFIGALPRRVRRRLGQRPSRVAKATPWAMWAADTLLMANAYSTLGAVALPFHDSADVSNAVMLVRAGAVAFGVTFGLKAAGSRGRDLVDDLRDQRPAAGVVGDAGVVGAVVAGAVWLASAAARLQQAFLALAFGGTSVHVPTSVLFAIVGFLGVVSFATGYASNEPQLAEAARLDVVLTEANDAAADAAGLLAEQQGVVRSVRKELANLREQHAYELVEHREQTEGRVFRHLDANRLIYGLENASTAAAVPQPARETAT